MAFTTSTSIRNIISWPTMAASDKSSDNITDGFSFRNKGVFKSNRNLQDLTVTNVASPLPVIAPPTPPETAGGRHHGAWSSIQHERWEGELVVQGQIPTWLVS